MTVVYMLPIMAALLAAAPVDAPATPDWSGHWQGTLENVPARPGMPVVTVERDIGAWPVRDGDCTLFRTRYLENGVAKGSKDYRLCRGATANDLYVDEGDVAEGKSIRLPAKLLGNVLVSPFKYGRLLLIDLTRVDGDSMIEEIYTADDAAAVEGGVVGLNARGIQRLTLKRTSRDVPTPKR